MACRSYPLDIAFASNAEVFDETKLVEIYSILTIYIYLKFRYRRSYDSDYSAPLVDHHIWPALMQGARVIVKVYLK